MMSQHMLRFLSLPGARVAGRQASRPSSMVRSLPFTLRQDLITALTEFFIVKGLAPELQRLVEELVGYSASKIIDKRGQRHSQAIAPSYVCTDIDIGAQARQVPVLIVRTNMRDRVVHLLIQGHLLCRFRRGTRNR
ncbi:hypothetical protein DQ393_16825 [Rhizobium tropici]|uniref:Uncharacterized protein n=1 Tax=Rhizobium tropici TaxID=398 RepID=A0A329Y7Y3_RHITR|nr:hypothetical protein DQ393_16825 [Rhizobium tropici]